MKDDKWEEVVSYAQRVQDKIDSGEEVFVGSITQVKKSFIKGDSWVLRYYEECNFGSGPRPTFEETYIHKHDNYNYFKGQKKHIVVIKRERIE